MEVSFTIPLTITVSFGQLQVVNNQPELEFEKTKIEFQDQLTTRLDEILEKKTCERS